LPSRYSKTRKTSKVEDYVTSDPPGSIAARSFVSSRLGSRAARRSVSHSATSQPGVSLLGPFGQRQQCKAGCRLRLL